MPEVDFSVFMKDMNAIIQNQMKKGRPSKYQLNKNLKIIKKSRRSRAMANCQVCGAKNILSRDWADHHDPSHNIKELDELDSIQVRQFIKELAKEITNYLENTARSSFYRAYPNGINNKEALIEQIIQGMRTNIESITTYPQRSISSASMFQREEQMMDEAEDEIEGAYGKQSIFADKILNLQAKSLEMRRMIQDCEENQLEKDKLALKNKIKSLKPEHIPNIYDCLKECPGCKQKFKGQAQKVKECQFCKCLYHQVCFNSIQNCVCQGKKPLQCTASDFQDVYTDPPSFLTFNILDSVESNILVMKIQSSQQSILKQEKKIIAAIEGRNLIYCNVARIPKSISNAQFSAFSDPFLKIEKGKLAEAYRRYAKGEYRAPVELKTIGQKGYGISAMEEIPKNTLICEYAADIVPASNSAAITHEDKIMVYMSGKNCFEEFIVAPVNFSNFGSLLNHNEKGNCSSLRTIIDGKIRILIWSKKVIHKGQQLTYNYNGALKEYPTQQFNDC